MSIADRDCASISIIVPVWNEGPSLAKRLDDLRELAGVAEIIVADASNTGESRAIAGAPGVIVVECEKPNRGAQMNAGAARARSDVLLFHHADSVLTQAHMAALQAAFRDPALIGGAFHRKFDNRHQWLRWLEPLARIFNQFGGSMFGDQSIFVRREIFSNLGGYAAIPLMEDLEFSRRLRRAGRVVLLDPPMSSSPRKHARQGPWQTSIENGLIILLYKLGASPHALHRWYYRDRTVHL